MSNRTVIIVGSARGDGNTMKVCQYLKESTNFDLVDLLNYNIQPFDYEYNNQDDDHHKLMERLLADYDTFIFATPVYWYSMSGIMKIFFDRISDLITVKKEMGRQLRTKNMAVISCSYSDSIISSFYEPFKLTATYLGMNYLGNIHTWGAQGDLANEVELRLSDFGTHITNHLNHQA